MTLLAPGAPEFTAQFRQFRFSCFRLETLPSYGASGEDASISAFLAGHDPQPHPGKQAWMANVQAAVRNGRTMTRVHVVSEPLSDYLRFEVAWSYAYSVAAGEDVRIVALGPDDPWPPHVPREDFWLFDSTELFLMRYAADGTWLGAEHVSDPPQVVEACRVRDAALHQAMPWADYIAQRPDLAGRVPAALRIP